MDTSNVLQAITSLEIYTTDMVQEWNKLRQQNGISEVQRIAANAKWLAYRDMANRLADLGELVERLLTQSVSQ